MISSLPGKAARMLVDIARLAKLFNCILLAEPGKLDTKRHITGILYLSVYLLFHFKLAIMTLFSIFVLIQRH